MDVLQAGAGSLAGLLAFPVPTTVDIGTETWLRDANDATSKANAMGDQLSGVHKSIDATAAYLQLAGDLLDRVPLHTQFVLCHRRSP